MARTKKSDMTDAQRVAADNNKFRKELYAQHVDQAQRATVDPDLDRFRKEQYKQALRDAKAQA